MGLQDQRRPLPLRLPECIGACSGCMEAGRIKDWNIRMRLIEDHAEFRASKNEPVNAAGGISVDDIY